MVSGRFSLFCEPFEFSKSRNLFGGNRFGSDIDASCPHSVQCSTRGSDPPALESEAAAFAVEELDVGASTPWGRGDGVSPGGWFAMVPVAAIWWTATLKKNPVIYYDSQEVVLSKHIF